MAWVALVMELPPIAELRHLPVYLFLGAVAGVCAAILVLAGFAHQAYKKSMTTVEIVEVFESPEPTRHHYSPTGSVYRRPSTAKRASKRRAVSHKRTYTLKYSPKTPTLVPLLTGTNTMWLSSLQRITPTRSMSRNAMSSLDLPMLLEVECH